MSAKLWWGLPLFVVQMTRSVPFHFTQDFTFFFLFSPCKDSRSRWWCSLFVVPEPRIRVLGHMPRVIEKVVAPVLTEARSKRALFVRRRSDPCELCSKLS